LAKGIATFIPGASRFACGRSYGTDSARYCYSVWFRHLTAIAALGLAVEFETIAELGPGDSLGIGLAAMLSGAARYLAFDAVPHARSAANLATLEQLKDLFVRREPVPGLDEFPEISPELGSLDFPHQILGDARLAAAMRPDRLDTIRDSLRSETRAGDVVRYVAPWTASDMMESDSVDLVLSQAVLEHVDGVPQTYEALFRWMKPGAIMSHAIDFKCHGLTRDWFGHWTVPAWQWRLVRGRRPYLINRLPASAHISAMVQSGFEIVKRTPAYSAAAPREELAREFREMDEDDLMTSSLFVVARKPARNAKPEA
jgi:hypothetical protein